MTSLPRLYSDHKTRVTPILRVFLRTLENLAYGAPPRNAVGPIKLRNDQSTLIVACVYHGTTLASVAGGHFLFFKGLKSTPAISAPLQRTLSLEGLTCVCC